MSTQVRTRDGAVEGEQRAGHLAFRGIPYALPPIAARRFRAPEPAQPWFGVRDARSFAPSAPQGSADTPWMEATGPQSEDCLYLNVYTPSCTGKRPVLFWIHGGGFVLGSGSSDLYDGGRLSQRGDVVVVTINYRLGALGYLYLAQHGGERIGASSNLGQLDQVAALRWVRDNIEAFGGDPDNVTIFGESAGSMAVCTLLAMPAARGLFQRAIAQSGAALEFLQPSAAAAITEEFLGVLQLDADRVERLLELDASQLVAAQNLPSLRKRAGMGYSPVLDPATLPLQPAEAIERGACADVPLMIGTNRDEINLFRVATLRELDKPMDEQRVLDVLSKQLPRQHVDQFPQLLQVYRESRARRGLPHSNRALIGALESDAHFRIPSIRFAEAYRARQPHTFMYLFTYESPSMRGALRACHALELPFVFGTLDAPFQDRFAGTGPAVDALSETMMDAWLSFAKTGNPSNLRAGDWVPYDTQRRATMVFDRQSRLEDAPYDEERAAWDA
ncbi:MAG TPA: carboxylesterase/lipase family protein [Polyangiales bacterium]|nr:carboxylesterase/lipase family protein [Polyangiales bacterium]